MSDVEPPSPVFYCGLHDHEYIDRDYCPKCETEFDLGDSNE